MEMINETRPDPEETSTEMVEHDGIEEGVKRKDIVNKTDTGLRRSPPGGLLYEDPEFRGPALESFADLLQAMKTEEWSQCADECINSSNQLKQHVGSAIGIMSQLNELLTQYITLVAEMGPLVEHVRNVNKLQFKIEKLNEIYMPLQQLTGYRGSTQTRKEE